jgi:hypothetical protein
MYWAADASWLVASFPFLAHGGKEKHRVVLMRLCLLVLPALAALAAGDARDCRTHPWPYANNTLLAGQSLHVGERLWSSTAYLIVESSGSAVVYRGSYPSTSQLWWSTNTDGTGLNALTLTLDGNLVLQNVDTGGVVWQANTTNSSIAVLQDNCALALYNAAPTTNQTWRTNTPLCLRAHVVPHSHDDVGWLLTPERYYDGCHDPAGGVQNIIGSMVSALASNRSRRFVQVESYLFDRWWRRQSETVRNVAQDVVARGQFTFINGGWSMQTAALCFFAGYRLMFSSSNC